LLPALLPKFQFDFCVQDSPETAAGAVLEEDVELDVDGEALAGTAGAVTVAGAAAGMLGAGVTAAVTGLAVDELEAEFDLPHPANNAMPAALPNKEMTRRRCTLLKSISVGAEFSVFLFCITKPFDMPTGRHHFNRAKM
jgi:hypothetical protein